MKGSIQSIDVSYLVHATEDPRRLGLAVEGMLGAGVQPETEELEGHFGNRITRVRYHMTGEVATAAFSGLVAKMSLGIREELLANLGGAVDEHSALYMRLDKQLLLSGKLGFASADPVRLRVKPRLFMMKGGANEFYRRALEEGG